MNIEAERQRIMELWANIDYATKVSLANIWEQRDEIEELLEREEDLESKVIKLLEIIPTLSKLSDDYHKHVVRLKKLIRHVEPSEKWLKRIHGDIEVINRLLLNAEEALQKRWFLPLETKEQLEKIKRFLEQYAKVFFDLLEKLPESENKEKIRSWLLQHLKQCLSKIEGLLEGHVPIEEAEEVISQTSASWYRDMTIVLIDTIFNDYRKNYWKSSSRITGNFFEDRKDLKSLIDELVRLSQMETILPKLGGTVDPRIHHHEPMGIPSIYPKGTIARVLQVGFIWVGTIFRPAIVELSAGPTR